MNNTKNSTKIAVGVGYSFIVANCEDVANIALENAGFSINIDGKTYPLYKGITFADSQKIDALMDTGKYPEYKTSYHRAKPKKVFDVTITRFGCVQIQADSPEEALSIANNMGEKDITWSDDWNATDAVCEEEVQ